MRSCGEMGLNKDNEFGSEEEDIEFRLYQKLYFEPNPDIEKRSAKKVQQHDRKRVSEASDKQITEPYSGQLNQVPDPKRTDSTTASKIHEDGNLKLDGSIHVHTLEGEELTLKEFTNKSSTKSTVPTKPLDNSSSDVFLSNVPLQSGRKRVSSTCSEGSIPGSVPLDLLYCNILESDEEFDALINNFRKKINANRKEKGKKKNNMRKRRDSTSQDDSAQDSRCDKLISAASKNTASKEEVIHLVEDSSSDDVCLLPPTKETEPEILTLKSGSDVEVVRSTDGTRVKTRNNKYRKTEEPLASTSTTRNEDGKGEGVNKVPVSGGNRKRKASVSVAAESDTDSNDVEMPEATRGTDLTLNIHKCLTGWVRTITKEPDTNKKKRKVAKKSPKKRVKWSVDFTKGRPDTTTKPSCEKWTQSMANFYDSDVSDHFDVSQVHQQQSDSAADWHLEAADYQIISKKIRYYNVPEKCKLCRQEGHKSENCPQIPVCRLCSKTDHSTREKCPENCCFKCGEAPHFHCTSSDMTHHCNLCGISGHHKNICPDLWRRFHLTTSGTSVEAPTEQATRPSEERYCYFCTERGHYGHQCPQRFKIHFQRLRNQSYVPVPQSVTSYDCPVKYSDGCFQVNIDSKSKTTLRIKRKHVARLKKGAKSIRKQSGANVLLKEDDQSQVLLFGPPEARGKAQVMIEKLLGKYCSKGFDECLLFHENSLPDTSTAADSSDYGLNKSWGENFLARLNRRKSSMEKQMAKFMKNLHMYTSFSDRSLMKSVSLVKNFKLKKESTPFIEPSQVVKSHLSNLAFKFASCADEEESCRMREKLDILECDIKTCRSGYVPENICVQFAETLGYLHEPSLEKMDSLVQYFEHCTKVRKVPRRKSEREPKDKKSEREPKDKKSEREAKNKYCTEVYWQKFREREGMYQLREKIARKRRKKARKNKEA